MAESRLDRINALARKSRTEGLTEEEKAEQTRLRREYVDAYRRNLESQLDNTYIVDPSGVKKKLERKS